MESSNQRPFTELHCEWTGELGELDLNSKLDKQLVDCAFAAVACTSLASTSSIAMCMFTNVLKSCLQHPKAATVRTIAQCMKMWPTTSLVPRPLSDVKIPKGVWA